MKNRCVNCDAPKGKPCPRWRDSWDHAMKNVVTGEVKLVSGCYYDIIVPLLFELCRSMNSAAAAVESSRNVIAEGFRLLDNDYVPIAEHSAQLKRLGVWNGDEK